jgi:hypothetical protein
MAVWLTKELMGALEVLEGLNSLNNLGSDDLAEILRLIFFGIHAALFDDTQPNVDNVAVDHGVAGAAGIEAATEEVQDKDLEAVGGVPISSHPFLVFFAIL